MAAEPDALLLERTLPPGVPLLASWWWRALVAGGSIGLVPLLLVLWHAADVPLTAWMDAHWPRMFTGVGILAAPELWLLGSACAFLWRAARRERVTAQAAFALFVAVGAAVLACGLVHAFGRGVTAIVAGERFARWSHLSPDTRCAAIAAAAVLAWNIRGPWRRTLAALVALTVAAEVALGVSYASDAVAGAWIGALAGLAVPWVRWRAASGWAVDAAPGVLGEAPRAE
jgi:membrane-associated phospholipid phosphatase